MRSFSSSVASLIDAGNLSYFFLITLKFNFKTYYLTSLPYDVEFPIGSGNIFLADGGLFEVDSPQFSTVLDREAYKVVIADINDEMLNEFRAGVIGKDITVQVGFLDENNEPLLNEDDVVFIYRGYVDKPFSSNDWDTKVAIIEGTSPMADLDSVNVRYTSKDDMDQYSLEDTSFDTIFDGEEITLKWGKA